MPSGSGFYRIGPVVVSRLVVLGVGPGADAVAAAVVSAFDRAGRAETYVVERATAELLDDAHVVVVADADRGAFALDEIARVLSTGFPGPIVVVCASAGSRLAAEGHDSGAHLWLGLPLDPRVFVANVESLARRLVGFPDAPDVRVELSTPEHDVRVEGRALGLTPRAFELFAYLLRRREIWLPSARIMTDVFVGSRSDDTRPLRVQAHVIRRRLGPELAWILQSDDRKGYRIGLSKNSTAGRRLLPHPRYRR